MLTQNKKITGKASDLKLASLLRKLARKLLSQPEIRPNLKPLSKKYVTEQETWTLFHP